jgi:hypothetical protein
MIVGGAAGAVALIIGLVLLMGGDERKRPKPLPAVAPVAVAAAVERMSPEEAQRLKNEGKAELAKGDALCRQAGGFNSPGFAAKMNEARGHLSKAMESFNEIPDSMSDRGTRALATKCARLLSICFKVPIDMH